MTYFYHLHFTYSISNFTKFNYKDSTYYPTLLKGLNQIQKKRKNYREKYRSNGPSTNYVYYTVIEAIQ